MPPKHLGGIFIIIYLFQRKTNDKPKYESDTKRYFNR